MEKGTLLVTAADALGSPSYPTKVGSGATLELSGGITVPEPIDLLGGKLVSTSGDNTLVNRLLLVGSSTLEVQKDSITLNPSSGDAVAVDSAQRLSPEPHRGRGWRLSSPGTLTFKTANPLHVW